MKRLYVGTWFFLAALAVALGVYIGGFWPITICSVVGAGCIFGGLYENVGRILDRGGR